jgi:hypothetical protein
MASKERNEKMSKYDELTKLKDLLNEGVLTVQEFESEKAKVLSKEDIVPATQENFHQNQPQPAVIVNNTNINDNADYFPYGNMKNKWVALLLCVFLGFLGAHKFYEGKILLGIVYLFTCGIGFVGVVIDFFAILFKPNPYFV